jgi:hypothetical protein
MVMRIAWVEMASSFQAILDWCLLHLLMLILPFTLILGSAAAAYELGPFANMTVNLGPIGFPNATADPLNGFGYNPRCLMRDIGLDLG